MKRITKRRAIGAALLAGLAAALVVPAIGIGSAGQGGTLKMIAWAGYLDVKWVTPFEKQSGCKIAPKIANTSDEMVALMRTGGAVSTTWSRPRATRACD
jgi:putative spermidine/putrescine transport system substrate-binding protein